MAKGADYKSFFKDAEERYASGYSHLEDRLMWPYYKASVIDKSVQPMTVQPMTRDEAVELLECERLKVCERGIAKGRVYREGRPGANDLHIVSGLRKVRGQTFSCPEAKRGNVSVPRWGVDLERCL
jgi:hypothetical protein